MFNSDKKEIAGLSKDKLEKHIGECVLQRFEISVVDQFVVRDPETGRVIAAVIPIEQVVDLEKRRLPKLPTELEGIEDVAAFFEAAQRLPDNK